MLRDVQWPNPWVNEALTGEDEAGFLLLDGDLPIEEPGPFYDEHNASVRE